LNVLFCFLLAAVLLPACTSTKPAPLPGRTRIQAEQAYETAQAEYRRQNWAAAAKSFERAADTFAAVDDFGAEATARHNCGQALRKAGQLDAAVESYQKALAINGRLKRSSEQAQNLAGLAACYRAQNKVDLAIQTGEEALKLATGSKSVVAKLENDLALSLLKRGDAADRDRVIQLLTSALKISEWEGNKRSIAANHLNLGRAQLQFDQATAAETSLNKALELFRSLDDPAGLAASHELLAKLYLKLGNTEKARFHSEQARAKYEFLKDEAGLRRVENLK
jgi:tetratricopeptide (TPR) repeat protein